jgi:hypothetical protein
MANINAPAGLAPVMYRSGPTWTGQARLYIVAAADTNPIYVGDPVKVTGVGDANGLQIVTLATAGATCRGVVIAVGLALPYGYQGGALVNYNDLTKTSRPAGAQATNYVVAVVDDPDVVFEVQEAFSATPIQATNMAKNANFVYAAPAAGVFLSGVTLDPTTVATTATLNLKIIEAVQRMDNTPYTAYQRFFVTINSHDYSTGVAGI